MEELNANTCNHGAEAPRYCALCRRAGVEGKQRGTDQAAKGQPDYHERAVAQIRTFARSGEPFTADDLIEAIGLPEGSGKVIGAAFLSVSRTGLIWRCGERPSARPSSHRRMLPVWRGGKATWMIDE